MALPGRGSRTIRAGNTEYCWLTSRRGPAVRVVVQRADGCGQLLVAEVSLWQFYVHQAESVWQWQPWLDPAQYDWGPPPFNHQEVGSGWSRVQVSGVTPKFVRQAIQEAIEAGWRPGHPGPAMRRSYLEPSALPLGKRLALPGKAEHRG
jgi:hypothetical protein